MATNLDKVQKLWALYRKTESGKILIKDGFIEEVEAEIYIIENLKPAKYLVAGTYLIRSYHIYLE